MAFEFIAPTTKCVSFIDLAKKLQDAGICITEAANSTGAQFRWNESPPPRESWPEDAEINMINDGLLLTIHSGTQQQRSRLIEGISLILSDMLNDQIRFEDA
jgi:hypothetical protein